jgi:transposase-like protein
MDAFTRDSRTEQESRLQQAIAALSKQNHTSIWAGARAFGVPEATLRHRMAGRDLRIQAQEHRQNFSPAEEKTLVRWIASLTKSFILRQQQWC